MKPYAEGLYNSVAWKQCREAYKKSKRYLCEDCLAKGILTSGEIVHHKIHLTPENINDPSVTLNFSNLRLVCRKCHGEEHQHRDRRFVVDDMGRVYVKSR